MTKEELQQQIIAALSADLEVFSSAAKAAHAAAIHEECIPDNKYDTTALEASYIAQGQANRAQEIRRALESYRRLSLCHFDEETPIRLTALVDLEDDDGSRKRVFLGPAAGGLRIAADAAEIVVITPHSPLGRSLIGKVTGDQLHNGTGVTQKTLTITAVC